MTYHREKIETPFLHGKDVVHDITVTITFSIPCEREGLNQDYSIWKAIEAIKDNPTKWKAYTHGVMMLYAESGDLRTAFVQATTYRED